MIIVSSGLHQGGMSVPGRRTVVFGDTGRVWDESSCGVERMNGGKTHIARILRLNRYR